MAQAEYPWYPWYPRDFEEDEAVLAMSDDEELAYRRLLDKAWLLGGSLPNDPVILARLAKYPDEKWVGVSQRVLKCFRKKSGRLVQKRLHNELKKTRARSRKAEDRAERRWKMGGARSSEATESHACALPKQCAGNAQAMLSTVTDIHTKILTSSLPSTSPASGAGQVKPGAPGAPESQTRNPGQATGDTGPPRLDPAEQAKADELGLRIERLVRGLLAPSRGDADPEWPALRACDADQFRALNFFEQRLFQVTFRRIRGFDFTLKAQEAQPAPHLANGSGGRAKGTETTALAAVRAP